MPSEREIRGRIKSVNDIMKITNAMYLISSSKMKKARQKLANTEPYFDAIQNTIAHILKHTPHTSNLFFHRRDEIPPEKRKKGYIIISGDKGLAGAYNHNILKLAEQEISKGGIPKLFIIGQVGRMYCMRHGIPYEAYFQYTAQNPSMYRARKICELIIKKFLEEELDDVYIVYTDMLTAMREEPRVIQLLPMRREKISFVKNSGYNEMQHTATFDPSPEVVMNFLVPNYAKGIIYGAMVEAFCSENHSRMMAMDAATKSAKELIQNLNLEYNRARQAAITQEITEIVSGAKGRDRD